MITAAATDTAEAGRAEPPPAQQWRAWWHRVGMNAVLGALAVAVAVLHAVLL